MFQGQEEEEIKMIPLTIAKMTRIGPTRISHFFAHHVVWGVLVVRRDGKAILLNPYTPY